MANVLLGSNTFKHIFELNQVEREGADSIQRIREEEAKNGDWWISQLMNLAADEFVIVENGGMCGGETCAE